jgi:hypothetical protein
MIVDLVFLIIIFALLQVLIQLFGFDLKHIKVEGFTHIDIESDNISETGKLFIYVSQQFILH